MLYAPCRGDILPRSRGLLLQYTALFRQHQTARSVHRQRTAPVRHNGRIYAPALDSGSSAELCLCTPSLRDSCRKEFAAHSADRRSHRQALRPAKHHSSFLDEARFAHIAPASRILRHCRLPALHGAQQYGFGNVPDAPRAYADSSVGMPVALAADKPDRRAVPACTVTGKERSPHRDKLDKAHARQEKSGGEAVPRLSSGNARHRDGAVCRRRYADGFRPQHRHFHQGGGVP